MKNDITADAALDAGARIVADLIGGLVTSPVGREDVILELIAQLSQAHELDEAGAEVLRRAVERLKGKA